MHTGEDDIVIDFMTKVIDIGKFVEWFEEEQEHLFASDDLALDLVMLTQLSMGNSKLKTKTKTTTKKNKK